MAVGVDSVEEAILCKKSFVFNYKTPESMKIGSIVSYFLGSFGKLVVLLSM